LDFFFKVNLHFKFTADIKQNQVSHLFDENNVIQCANDSYKDKIYEGSAYSNVSFLFLKENK
jgi:hypothetical protein